MELKRKKRQKRTSPIFVFLVFTVSLVFLGAGFLGMEILAGLKKPPAKKKITEKPLQVEIFNTKYESVTPVITGYGEAKAIDVLEVAAEISGKVTYIHPGLEEGELVKKGDVLLKIDTREEALTLKSNKNRLKTAKRNLKLVKNEFLRMEKLNSKRKLVTVSEVEKAEQAFNNVTDLVNQLEFAIALSQLTINRATLIAPFDGRIKSVSLEKGQYVSPGSPLLTLVNDSLLEIHVPVDSEEARKKLRFDSKAATTNRLWFSGLEQVPVKVIWSGDKQTITSTGILHRIIAINPDTRMLRLAVRLTPASRSKNNVFPIVEGMFCQVQIPGKTMNRVIRVPRKAVYGDEKVKVVIDNRLKTIPVETGGNGGDHTYITAGLKPNDQVIITRLSNPLENSLIESTVSGLVASNKGRSKP